MHLAGLANAAADALSHPSEFPAHRRLIEALLRAGEPDAGAPSYALLWQHAAIQQQRAGGMTQDVERALELLVTEVLALSRSAPWFRSRPRLRDHAIEETIAYWNGVEDVASQDAHGTWRRCWESRMEVTQSVRLDLADLTAAVAVEQRLQREWAARWRAWSERLVPGGPSGPV